MAQAKWLDEPPDGDAPLLPRRKLAGDAEADMTPMIDMTFLLLIFFIVTQSQAQKNPVELPVARHGIGVSQSHATVLVISEAQGNAPAHVYLGDSLETRLPDAIETQEAAVRDYVAKGLIDDRKNVLIKAGRRVHHRDVARVAAAAGQVEGVTINLAVLEEE
jgi:biopolymer transport protein ExbD